MGLRGQYATRRQLRKQDHFERDRTIHVYCTGCKRLFPKTHLLLKHRYAFACGGDFRIEDEIHNWKHIPQWDPDPMRLKTKRRSPHRGRRPGTVRRTRMPRASGFRGWKTFETSTVIKFFGEVENG